MRSIYFSGSYIAIPQGWKFDKKNRIFVTDRSFLSSLVNTKCGTFARGEATLVLMSEIKIDLTLKKSKFCFCLCFKIAIIQFIPERQP